MSTNTKSNKVRSYEDECKFIHQLDSELFKIDLGFVPGMKVPGYFYANSALSPLMFDELKSSMTNNTAQMGGFLPAVRQIANVASLPGIVKGSIALPDCHSGYGFSM